MPTAKQRHMITETDAIAQALDKAAGLWPELASNRTALVRKLLEQGAGVLEVRISEQKAGRLMALDEITGQFDNLWTQNYLEEARSEWPA